VVAPVTARRASTPFNSASDLSRLSALPGRLKNRV
jgi:hypothetical protein